MSEPRSDEEWVDFYADHKGVYEAFVARLEDLVESLLDEHEIGHGWVSSFTRAPNAFAWDVSRARRAGQVYENPLESPLRLAGVTVIAETPAPVPEIVELVTREFAIDLPCSLSIDEAAARNERLARADRSGGLAYECPHYLVSLDERRLELPEWARFAGLKVRIEVKTVLQEAWEAIDLDLPFYEAGSYPAEVRNLLERSALGLSAIDADLTEAKDAISRALAEYEESIAAGELQFPMNGVSLLAYLRTSELVRSLTEVGEDVGFVPERDYALDWADVVDILWLLDRAGVHTIAELEEFLQRATSRTRDTLAALLHVTTDRGFTPSAQPDHIVEWLWLVLHRADAETIAMLRYTEEIAHSLNTVIGNPATPESKAP